MPGCCIINCKNSAAKGFRLFAFPSGERNADRRKTWLCDINQDNVPVNAKICEVHFSESQFEQSRADRMKKLTPNAHPDLVVNHKRRKCDATDAPSSSVNEEIAHEDIHEDNLEVSFDEIEREVDNIQTIKELRQRLKAALAKCRKYEKKLQEKSSTNLEQVFNEDQLVYLEKHNSRGSSWSEDTITRALRLYLACGSKGYEEIRKQNLPYPSIRTLQHRIRNLRFKAGILDQVFDMLKLKVSIGAGLVNRNKYFGTIVEVTNKMSFFLKVETFQPQEKHATLMLDEMAITPGLQYDNTLCQVVGRPTMNASGGVENSNELATHALVIILGGLSTRWKQIVRYEFTGNSFCASELYNRVTQILQKSYAVGITVKVVISDMGGQNRSMWKKLNIVASRFSKISNFVKHPCIPNKKLFFMADPVYVFKNLASALRKGHQFILEDSIVQKYNLPSNMICIEPIKQLFKIESNDVLKLSPRLKKSVLEPSHFDTMNVALSVALLNHAVSAAILHYISQGKIDAKHRTTAWFLSKVYYWFKLMTARQHTFALSTYNKENYEDAIHSLNSMQEIVYNLSVNGKWMPFQTGIVLSTQTALDVHKIYLEEDHFQYIMLGRFTQDALENYFSSIRCRQPIPDAHMFRVSLRLLCLSQFETNVSKSNYQDADSSHLVNYCNELNKTEVHKNDAEHSISDADIQSLIKNYSVEDLNESLESSLYYLLGSILYKVKSNRRVCNICYSSVTTTDTTAIGNTCLLQIKGV